MVIFDRFDRAIAYVIEQPAESEIDEVVIRPRRRISTGMRANNMNKR